MEDKEVTPSEINESFKSITKKYCQRFIKYIFRYLKMYLEKKHFL